MSKHCFTILLLLFAVASCVPKTKYEDLQYELSRKEDEISDLENQVSQLESELEDCQSELRDCQSDYNELYNVAESFSSYHNKVVEDYTDLINEYNSLQSFNNSVSSATSFNTNVYGNTKQGNVVYEGKSDYYIVQTQQYYVLLETYSGWLSTGDVLAGDLHSYGFKDVLKNGNTTMRVYIENYWSNINMCYDWLRDHDKLK